MASYESFIQYVKAGLLILQCLGTLGSSLFVFVVIVIRVRATQEKHARSIAMATFAIVSFLYAGCILPIYIATAVLNSWLLGTNVCAWTSFIEVYITGIMVSVVCVMAVDCLLSLRFSGYYSRHSSFSREITIAILLMFVYPLVFTLPSLFPSIITKDYFIEEYACMILFSSNVTYSLLLISTVLSLGCLLIFVIAFIIKRYQARTVPKNSETSSINSETFPPDNINSREPKKLCSARDLKCVVYLSFATIGFMLPYTLYLYITIGLGLSVSHVNFVLRWLAHCHPVCINLIYCVFDDRCRKTIANITGDSNDKSDGTDDKSDSDEIDNLSDVTCSKASSIRPREISDSSLNNGYSRREEQASSIRPRERVDSRLSNGYGRREGARRTRAANGYYAESSKRDKSAKERNVKMKHMTKEQKVAEVSDGEFELEESLTAYSGSPTIHRSKWNNNRARTDNMVFNGGAKLPGRIDCESVDTDVLEDSVFHLISDVENDTRSQAPKNTQLHPMGIPGQTQTLASKLIRSSSKPTRSSHFANRAFVDTYNRETGNPFQPTYKSKTENSRDGVWTTEADDTSASRNRLGRPYSGIHNPTELSGIGLASSLEEQAFTRAKFRKPRLKTTAHAVSSVSNISRRDTDPILDWKLEQRWKSVGDELDHGKGYFGNGTGKLHRLPSSQILHHKRSVW